MPALVLIVEGCERYAYPLGKATLLIGRTEGSDIQLPSEIVSGNHASIVLDNGDMVLRDNGSENGSFVNGERVDRRPLRHLDLVRFGEYLFIVDMHDVITAAKPTLTKQREATIERPRGRPAAPSISRRQSQRIAGGRMSQRISLKLSKPLKKSQSVHGNIMLNSL